MLREARPDTARRVAEDRAARLHGEPDRAGRGWTAEKAVGLGSGAREIVQEGGVAVGHAGLRHLFDGVAGPGREGSLASRIRDRL